MSGYKISGLVPGRIKPEEPDWTAAIPELIDESEVPWFDGPCTSMKIEYGPYKDKWLHIPLELDETKLESIRQGLREVWSKWYDWLYPPWDGPVVRYHCLPKGYWPLLGPPCASYPMTQTPTPPFSGPHTAVFNAGGYFTGWYLHVPRYLAPNEMNRAERNLSNACQKPWDWGDRHGANPVAALTMNNANRLDVYSAQKGMAQLLENELGLDFNAQEDLHGVWGDAPIWLDPKAPTPEPQRELVEHRNASQTPESQREPVEPQNTSPPKPRPNPVQSSGPDIPSDSDSDEDCVLVPRPDDPFDEDPKPPPRAAQSSGQDTPSDSDSDADCVLVPRPDDPFDEDPKPMTEEEKAVWRRASERLKALEEKRAAEPGNPAYKARGRPGDWLGVKNPDEYSISGSSESGDEQSMAFQPPPSHYVGRDLFEDVREMMHDIENLGDDAGSAEDDDTGFAVIMQAVPIATAQPKWIFSDPLATAVIHTGMTHTAEPESRSNEPLLSGALPLEDVELVDNTPETSTVNDNQAKPGEPIAKGKPAKHVTSAEEKPVKVSGEETGSSPKQDTVSPTHDTETLDQEAGPLDVDASNGDPIIEYVAPKSPKTSLKVFKKETSNKDSTDSRLAPPKLDRRIPLQVSRTASPKNETSNIPDIGEPSISSPITENEDNDVSQYVPDALPLSDAGRFRGIKTPSPKAPSPSPQAPSRKASSPTASSPKASSPKTPSPKPSSSKPPATSEPQSDRGGKSSRPGKQRQLNRVHDADSNPFFGSSSAHHSGGLREPGHVGVEDLDINGLAWVLNSDFWEEDPESPKPTTHENTGALQSVTAQRWGEQGEPSRLPSLDLIRSFLDVDIPSPKLKIRGLGLPDGSASGSEDGQDPWTHGTVGTEHRVDQALGADTSSDGEREDAVENQPPEPGPEKPPPRQNQEDGPEQRGLEQLLRELRRRLEHLYRTCAALIRSLLRLLRDAWRDFQQQPFWNPRRIARDAVFPLFTLVSCLFHSHYFLMAIETGELCPEARTNCFEGNECPLIVDHLMLSIIYDDLILVANYAILRLLPILLEGRGGWDQRTRITAWRVLMKVLEIFLVFIACVHAVCWGMRITVYGNCQQPLVCTREMRY